MLVCNGSLSFECSLPKTYAVGEIQCVRFDIFKPISPEDIKALFSDNEFYFYDEISNGRLSYTDDKKTVGLRIIYGAASTNKIIIKLT